MSGKKARRFGYLRLGIVSVLLLAFVPIVAPPVMYAQSEESVTQASVHRPTVVTFDAVGPGQLVVYSPNGAVLYRNETYDIYHDIDPDPSERRTIMYVASELNVPDSRCGASACILNVVERLNLTTGNVTRLYARVSPRVGSSQIHDVDRINESVLLVADIGTPNRVYMVNITTDTIVWEWYVREAYSPQDGGMYPHDWTHLNDVEYLPDGRVMVSLRNMDQVVFIEPGEGLLRNWTLGEDDNYHILFQQHNPDYIPPSRGGPSILVADSENNRIVEYQRVDGEWIRTWYWRDARLQWPRDADRLPNGNTLIVDTHGGRILEVAPSGEIVWQLEVPDGAYDAERLGTGDESTGGLSAVRLNYESRFVHFEGDLLGSLAFHAMVLVPNRVLHGLLAVLPGWTTALGATMVLFQLVVASGWVVGEAVSAYAL